MVKAYLKNIFTKRKTAGDYAWLVMLVIALVMVFLPLFFFG